MDIKRYREIKRTARRNKYKNMGQEEAKELLQLLDDHRDFINHLRAYMTMGYSTKFKTHYDILAAANELADRIK